MGLNPLRVAASSEPATELSTAPALLVLTEIVAEDRILLLKRGLEPYRGKWAPPGGFVEQGESSLAAAIREVWEEVRVLLEPGQLRRHSVLHVPQLNQLYHVYTAHLRAKVSASAVAPETQDVGWFLWRELSDIPVWEPGLFTLPCACVFAQSPRAGDRFSRPPAACSSTR